MPAKLSFEPLMLITVIQTPLLTAVLSGNIDIVVFFFNNFHNQKPKALKWMVDSEKKNIIHFALLCKDDRMASKVGRTAYSFNKLCLVCLVDGWLAVW